MTRVTVMKIVGGALVAVGAVASSAYSAASAQVESRGGMSGGQTGDMADMVRGRQMLSDADRRIREREIAARQNGARRAAKAVMAVEADLTVGSPLYDLADQELGRISGVGPQGVELAIHNGTIAIPTAAIFKYRDRLLLKISKTEFDAQIAAARR